MAKNSNGKSGKKATAFRVGAGACLLAGPGLVPVLPRKRPT
jgi:hypothetical protein